MSGGAHVLVVGGTKGLGRVICERCQARGDRVSVIARNRPKDSAGNQQLNFIEADLATLAKPDQIVEQALGFGGKISYIIFAQRYRGDGDPWQGEMQVSLTATKLLIDAFSGNFAAQGDRAIAVVSSVYADYVGGSQPVGYHVAKAGTNQLVRYYACALGKKGVRVNAIMPLTYLKDESRDFYLANDKLMDLYRRFVPLGRPGDVEDSANLLEFLCSDKAGFINGQCIAVDGGVSVVWPEALARDLTGI